MSRIVSTQILLPSLHRQPSEISYPLLGGRYVIPRALDLPEDRALVDLPQPRSFNSLSRAGLMLNAVGLSSRTAIEPYVAKDSFSVGVYCAIENGPDDFHAAVQMLDTRPEDFASTYKSLRSPKQHFRLLTNVPASQLAIFLGIQGVLHVFNHSRFATDQALDQAEFDLAHLRVAAAVVCSAFSFENPLISVRTSRALASDVILCEAAACLVLTADGKRTNWEKASRWSGPYCFGIADSLVRLADPPLHADTFPMMAGAREALSSLPGMRQANA